jgi:taurine dioxygenase
VEVVALPGAFGVELCDVDLRRTSHLAATWTRAEVDELRARWDRDHLLLVRGPVLTGEQQLAFVARFGRLVAERQPWSYVSNVRPDGIVREGALLFHSDFAFTPCPVTAISLHALEVPADGAPTQFASAVNAVDALSPELRRELERRQVLNVYDFTKRDDRRTRELDLAPGSPTCAHPAIGAHPRTGAPVVYANELHSDRILDVSEEQSEALLKQLFRSLYDEQNVYEHRWSEGDLVLWDNVALHHARRNIPRVEPRTLQRVTLGDYTPGELVPNLAELLAAR